jgi:peptidyl-dipeptidase Dcp
MNQFIRFYLPAVLLILAVDGNSQSNFTQSNPFYNESKLPYQAPAFDKIKDSDFKPAMEEGMRLQLLEIGKIADNPAAPTFENTLVAMEKSGQLLDRANRVFDVLTAANTNPKLQKIRQELAPKQAAHRDAIYLNSKLFKRVETLYKDLANLKLDAESNRLVEFYYQRFSLAGAKLLNSDKINLTKLNEEEASLSTKFNSQLLAGTKAGALVIDDASKLSGLTQGEMEAAARDAKARKLDNKWVLLLQNTTQQPALQSITNRETRQKLFEASWTRTVKKDSNDTRNTVAQLAKIRAEKAKLIGFSNYAGLKLQDQMAKTPEAVNDFLAQLVEPATAKAKGEAAEIQAIIDKQRGGFKLEPWDWNYYAEQIRKEKYDLDANEIKPYLELKNVLENGVFYAANLLYGLTFKERHDLPVYQEDVMVFEVFDQDGSSLGLFYGDYFKRDNKLGGAWMNNSVRQSYLLGTKPVINNTCNFTKPATGQPALISFENVTTMFHEFGHALHGFLASQKYPSLSGTSVARDFVEFPSQFNEHWALDPKVLKNYAIHYKTKEPMPQVLVDRIKKAAGFNAGFSLTEALAACLLDMQWHTLSAEMPLQDADQFEKESLKKTKIYLPEVPPRYRSTYFSHVFSSGYAAGYFSYLWTDMLEEDIYSWFQQNGGLTRANGQRLRDLILSRGNTQEYGKMFRAFQGRNPDIKPMLKSKGLVAE